MDLDKISPIYLGGFIIPVVDASAKLKLANLVGYFDGDEPFIELRSTEVGEQVQAQTLLHEALHAIAAIYLEGEKVEERIVAGLSQGLYQLLTDNVGLVQALWASMGQDDVCPGCLPEECKCPVADEPIVLGHEGSSATNLCFWCNRPTHVTMSLGGCVCASTSDAPTGLQ